MQTKKYRAKVANVDASGIRWEAGDIQEVSSEQGALLSHHWEELAPAKDGSEDAELKKKLAEQDKLDNLRDERRRKSYDEVRPSLPGGAAVGSLPKSGEEKTQALKDRKAEEKANEDRRKKGESRAVVVENNRVVVETPKPAQAATVPVRASAPVTAGQPSGRPVPPQQKAK